MIWTREGKLWPRDLLHGKPRIKGTRILVEQVLDLLSEDVPVREIQKRYLPDLTRKDILACVGFSRDMVKNEEIQIVVEP